MKYSWEKVEENKFYLWHTNQVGNDEFKTLIAITDTPEKAVFLTRATNEFPEITTPIEVIPSAHLPPETWLIASPVQIQAAIDNFGDNDARKKE